MLTLGGERCTSWRTVTVYENRLYNSYIVCFRFVHLRIELNRAADSNSNLETSQVPTLNDICTVHANCSKYYHNVMSHFHTLHRRRHIHNHMLSNHKHSHRHRRHLPSGHSRTSVLNHAMHAVSSQNQEPKSYKLK